MERNIKVTEKDSFDIIRKFQATFESYWNDEEFTSFNGTFEEDKKRLITSLKREGKLEGNSDTVFSLDIHPYYYQKEIIVDGAKGKHKNRGEYRATNKEQSWKYELYLAVKHLLAAIQMLSKDDNLVNFSEVYF